MGRDLLDGVECRHSYHEFDICGVVDAVGNQMCMMLIAYLKLIESEVDRRTEHNCVIAHLKSIVSVCKVPPPVDDRPFSILKRRN